MQNITLAISCENVKKRNCQITKSCGSKNIHYICKIIHGYQPLSEIKHDKLHFCLNDILRCQEKWGGGEGRGGGCPHHCTLLLMRSSVSSAVVAAIACLENVVLYSLPQLLL